MFKFILCTFSVIGLLQAESVKVQNTHFGHFSSQIEKFNANQNNLHQARLIVDGELTEPQSLVSTTNCCGKSQCVNEKSTTDGEQKTNSKENKVQEQSFIEKIIQNLFLPEN